MATDNIVHAAQTAGFDLTDVETALLTALTIDGNFDGLNFRKSKEGTEVAEELRAWLPSVWKGNVQNQEVSEANEIDIHRRLYAEAPFPIISGVLLEWLLSTQGLQHLSGINISNIKVAGGVHATKCKVDFNIRLVSCIVEENFWLTVHVDASLSLVGVLASSIVISGESKVGINLSDIQGRFWAGRGFCSINLVGLTTPSIDIYGLYVPQGMVIRDCAFSDMRIRGRSLGCRIYLERCEVADVLLNGMPDDPFSFLSTKGLNVTNSCSISHTQGLAIKETAIQGDFKIENVANDTSMTFSGVDIKGKFSINLGQDSHGIRLEFDHVEARHFADNADDLQRIKQLKVEGLVYQELIDWGADEAKKRIAWLALQPQNPFPLASWRRVGEQLRRRGRFQDARRLLIESERRRRAALHKGWAGRLASWILRVSLGYGWKLWRMAWLALALVTIGAMVASWGMDRKVFVDTSDQSKSVVFNPIIYSIDEALPIIDFRHGSQWLPTGKGWDGKIVQIYFWFHTLLGWVIATLFVIGFSGNVRKIDNE